VPAQRARLLHVSTLLAVASLLLASCGTPDAAPEASESAAVAEAAIPWPTAGWQRSTPEAAGIDAAGLEAADAELRSGEHGYVDSLLVIRNGRLVADYRYQHDYVAASAPYDPEPEPYDYYSPDWHPFYQGSALHTMQSVTKSVTSALIGIAIGRGEIAGVDAPMLALLGDRTVPDPDGRKARVTLADLLTMRAGIAWDESTMPYTDPRNDCAQMEASDDWVGYVLGKPMAADPGTVFVYNSGVSQLLSQVLRHATGMTADAYAEQHLFGPLGIREHYWKITPGGLPDTEGGLYLLPEDLAKIGLLFLHDGMWDGRRVLPEGWAAQSTATLVADVAPEDPGNEWRYGYQWWLLEPPAASTRVIAARGYGGQFLLVAPELDLVTVFTGWNIFDRAPSSVALFLDRILPAVAAANAEAP
jgi:CubicO group peptidase (beta-lactamase class C family)